MSIVPRGALVIKAKQPMLDWINNHPDAAGLTLTLDQVNEDSTVILIPEFDFDDQAEKIVKSLARWIFEGELGGWFTNKETWPKRRGYKTLLEWFDVEIHSMVIDSVLDDEYSSFLFLEDAGDSSQPLPTLFCFSKNPLTLAAPG